MNKLAVFGNPIAHSISPQIHQQFAKQCSVLLDYQKIIAPFDQFQQYAQQFIASGGIGFNVTMPFKVIAYDWLAHHTERANQAGAVNTVLCQNGQWIGDNTDGIGFLRDCQKKQITFADKTIIVLGSGGAAQGIISVLLAAHPARLIIVQRDQQKKQMCDEHLVVTEQIMILSYAEIGAWLPECTLLIDATSSCDVLKETLCAHKTWSNQLVIYDLKYDLAKQTPAVIWAQTQGLQAYDGLGMLIEQAAEAFFQWFGICPAVEQLTRTSLFHHTVG